MSLSFSTPRSLHRRLALALGRSLIRWGQGAESEVVLVSPRRHRSVRGRAGRSGAGRGGTGAEREAVALLREAQIRRYRVQQEVQRDREHAMRMGAAYARMVI